MRFYPDFRIADCLTEPALDFEVFRLRLWLLRKCKNECKRTAKRRKLLKRLRP